MVYLSVLMTTIVSFVAVSDADNYCKQGWTLNGQHCFKLYNDFYDWNGARQFCLSQKAHLPIIQDKATQDFIVKEFLPGAKEILIGLNDMRTSGTFVWADSNAIVNYTNWAPGQPNNDPNEDCAIIWPQNNGKWHDVNCNDPRAITLCQSPTMDECDWNRDFCDTNAACKVSRGSLRCSCNAGYDGNGVTCTDVDECNRKEDNCDTNAVCQNTPGSFSCSCNTGHDGDGVTCTDVDECNRNEHNCDTNAVCQNTPGSFRCSCNTGYDGDGVTCTDVDECNRKDNCDTNAVCQNTPGSFSCSCNTGYDGDGVTCTDVDECNRNEDNCNTNEVCQNTAGSFRCSCNTGCDGVTYTDQYCKQGWTKYGQACFRLYGIEKTWKDARLHCLSENANLAVIPDAATDNFLYKELFSSNDNSAWIGLNDRVIEGTDHQFVWEDSDIPVTFSRWATGEPNIDGNDHHCGRIWNEQHDRWGVLGCANKLPFLCQSKTTCVRRNKYLVIMV